MENVTRIVVEQLNNTKYFNAGLFILDSKEPVTSGDWSDGIQWAVSKCVTRNKKSRIWLMLYAWLCLFVNIK